MALISERSYEDNLGEAIERLLAKGAVALGDFVVGLNEMNVRGPMGQVWTAELLAAEFARLGV